MATDPQPPRPTGCSENRTEGDALYREYFARSADAFLIIEGDTFVDCNEATVAMLGYETREEVLQTHPSEHSPERQPDGRLSYAKANEMMEQAFARGSHRFEWEHKRADGRPFPVEVLLTAVEGAGRRLLHVVWRDLSERKHLERELQQAQKMDALGRLSGGIAHDFNNLLVAIIGRAELLEMDLEDDPEALVHVREVLRAGERAADLVRQLLAFSRKQWMKPQVLDLNEAVREIRAMLERLLDARISLVIEVHDEPLWIEADPGQIDQVLVNLAVNARDAMPGGGTLTLGTRPAEGGTPLPGLPEGLAPGRYACLSASDTGVGIDSETLPHIFDPFFTTKENGEGTGLGLAMAYGIVKQSGGEITASSETGRGATFGIYLPAAEPQDERAEAEAEERDFSLHGDETVLLVEDDPAVVRLASTMLERAGYRVVAAVDGAQALAVLESGDCQPDLVLTDVIMPNMSGPELAVRLRSARPDVRILFTSGYTADRLSATGVDLSDEDMLVKPYSSHNLLLAVRRALDA